MRTATITHTDGRTLPWAELHLVHHWAFSGNCPGLLGWELAGWREGVGVVPRHARDLR